MCMCTRAGVVCYLLEKWWYALGQLWEGFLPGSDGPYTSALLTPFKAKGTVAAVRSGSTNARRAAAHCTA